MGKFVKVCKKSEIPTDCGYGAEVEGRPVALYQVDGKVYAIDAICPHQGGPLNEGGIDGKMANCPWHGWQFDVTTGVCDFNDRIKVATFPTKEDGDQVSVEI